jgi:hypothetical protein
MIAVYPTINCKLLFVTREDDIARFPAIPCDTLPPLTQHKIIIILQKYTSDCSFFSTASNRIFGLSAQPGHIRRVEKVASTHLMQHHRRISRHPLFLVIHMSL